MTLKSETLRQRVEFDLADSLDEEYEMELDDDRLDKLLSETADHQSTEGMDRRVYFRELFRLQGEPRHQIYQRFYAGANLSF